MKIKNETISKSLVMIFIITLFYIYFASSHTSPPTQVEPKNILTLCIDHEGNYFIPLTWEGATIDTMESARLCAEVEVDDK